MTGWMVTVVAVRSRGQCSSSCGCREHSQLHLQSFSSSPATCCPVRPQVVPQRSILDALLLGEWEDRAEAGLFRYDVTACPTKLVRLGGQQRGVVPGCWRCLPCKQLLQRGGRAAPLRQVLSC